MSSDGRHAGTTGLTEPGQVAGQEPGRPSLALFVAMICNLLRGAGKLGWLDRNVVEGVKVLTRLIVDLHAAAGGFTLALDADGFRHAESGERLAAQGKAVVQLHRLFQRRGWGGASFKTSVTPLGVKNLLQGLLDANFDAATALGRDGSIVLARTVSRTVPDILILRDGHEHSLADLPDVPPSGDDGAASPARRPERVSDPLDTGAPGAEQGLRQGRTDGRAGGGNAPIGGRGPARVAGELEGQLQELRRENKVIREAMAGMVTMGAGPASQPAILTCIDAMESDEHLQYLLVSLRQHDRYTFDHSCNVALIAVAIARGMGFQGEQLQRFATAALLHDIGKLYTPLSVLNKPGKFSPEEWKAMRRHPQDGMEILDGAGFQNEHSERVTLLHHLGYDGQGYPANARTAPDVFAHIVQVADIYDAFTSIRPYRQQARPREVLEVLRKGAGQQFSPVAVDAALKLMGGTPLASVLKLDNGQLGLVVDIGCGEPGRPLVRIIQDEFGNRPQRTVLLDLAARIPATGEYLVDVVESVDPVIRNIPIGRYI